MKEYVGKETLEKQLTITKSAVKEAKDAADAAQSVADTAQTTANQAISDAAAAKATADEKLSATNGGIKAPLLADNENGSFLQGTQNNIFSLNRSSRGFPFISNIQSDSEVSRSVILRGVETPVKNNDAANKEYVDSNRSNPNLLDNWYFADPINQRGQTEYTGDTFTIDRWRILNGMKTTLVPNSHINLTKDSTGVYKEFFTVIELPEQVYLDRPLTLSCLYKGKSSRFYMRREGGATSTESLDFYFPDSTDWTVASTSFTFSGVTNSTVLKIMFGIVNNDGISIKAAKLELGSQQTLAHKEGDTWVLNDPPPVKSLELLKCQRYYESKYVQLVHNKSFNDMFHFNVEKRAAPSISISSPKGTANKIGAYVTNAWTDIDCKITLSDKKGFVISSDYSSETVFAFTAVASADL